MPKVQRPMRPQRSPLDGDESSEVAFADAERGEWRPAAEAGIAVVDAAAAAAAVVGVVDVVVTLPVQLCGGMEGSGSGSLWMM